MVGGAATSDDQPHMPVVHSPVGPAAAEKNQQHDDAPTTQEGVAANSAAKAAAEAGAGKQGKRLSSAEERARTHKDKNVDKKKQIDIADDDCGGGTGLELDHEPQDRRPAGRDDDNVAPPEGRPAPKEAAKPAALRQDQLGPKEPSTDGSEVSDDDDRSSMLSSSVRSDGGSPRLSIPGDIRSRLEA